MKYKKAIFAFILVVVGVCYVIGADKLHSRTSKLIQWVETGCKNQREIEANELLSMIPVEERDSILVPDGKGIEFYLYTNTMPCKRLFVCPTLFAKVTPGMDKEYEDCYIKDAPKWLVHAREQLPDEIADKYTKMFEGNRFRLYRINEE